MTRYREILLSRYRSTRYADENPDTPEDRRNRAEAYESLYGNLLPNDKDAAILDLGCGHGELLEFLRARGFRNARGTDASAQQVEEARRRGLPVEQADAVEHIGRQAGLDLVLATDLIEHLTKDEVTSLLRGIHDALKPGGRLIVQTPNMASLYGFIARYADFTHETGFTETSLAQVLKACGFTRVVVSDSAVPFGWRPKRLARWALSRLVRGFLAFCLLIEVGMDRPKLYGKLLVAQASRQAP